MLPTGGESDRFLIAKETKLLGGRSAKFMFCYELSVLDLLVWAEMHAPKQQRNRVVARASQEDAVHWTGLLQH